MADEVQWIKLKVGMFDGASFKRIKRAKIGGESFRDKLTAVWFELMDFAGKCNRGGQLGEIPFSTIDDIATMIDRETDELELCMQFYVREGMVEIIDDIYSLSNWSYYQNEEKLSKLREQKRLRQQKWRNNKALKEGNTSNVDGFVSTQVSTDRLPSIIEIEEDKEKEEDINNISPTPSPIRHKYGAYNNVLLSDEDMEKLQNEFPTDYEARIERLSEYIASKGAKYKNHLATIRSWARKEKPQQKKESEYDRFMGKLQQIYDECED